MWGPGQGGGERGGARLSRDLQRGWGAGRILSRASQHEGELDQFPILCSAGHFASRLLLIKKSPPVFVPRNAFISATEPKLLFVLLCCCRRCFLSPPFNFFWVLPPPNENGKKSSIEAKLVYPC